MKNKKGFTLIELLAIIVVMALILITAVPKAIDIIEDSRTGTWNNSVKGVAKAINKSITTLNPDTDGYMYNVNELCSNTSKLKEIVDIENANVTCSGNTFTLTGKGKFEGKTGKIVCTNNKCKAVITDGEPSLATGPGLYDKDDKLLASWDELVNTYHLDLNWAVIIDPSAGCLNFTQEQFDQFSDEERAMAAAEGMTEPGWYCLSGDSENPSVKRIWDMASILNKSELKSGTKLILPDTITDIPQGAFYQLALKEIILPDALKSIGPGAFYNSSIVSITIPENVDSIGGDAFGECNSLKNATLKMKTIPVGLFKDLSSLESITLDENVETVEKKAWENLSNLKMLTFKNPFGWYVPGQEGEGTFSSVYINKRLAAEIFKQSSQKIYRDKSIKLASNYVAGLYDKNNNLIASWYDLINVYGMMPIYLPYVMEGTSILGYQNAYIYLDSPTTIATYLNISEQNSGNITEPGWYQLYNSNASAIHDVGTINSPQPGVIFEKFPELKKGTKLVIEQHDLAGEYAALSYASLLNVEEIVLPPDTSVFGESTFAFCPKLKKITIPANVRGFDAPSFLGDTALTSVVFEDPTGWKIGDTPVDASQLRNPSTAAELIKSHSSNTELWSKE